MMEKSKMSWNNLKISDDVFNATKRWSKITGMYWLHVLIKYYVVSSSDSWNCNSKNSSFQP